MTSESLNIILFGERGVGKSSVINLISGREIAGTSPYVQEGTMSFESHSFDISGQRFRIWETVGIEEPNKDFHGFLSALFPAGSLIQDLTSHGGVDLLLFCVRPCRTTGSIETMQSNYKVFYEFLCRCDVPIALVITHLELEEPMENWWASNKKFLEGYGMKFVDHACVTGLADHRKYDESRANISRLLEGRKDSDQYRLIMPPSEWWFNFCACLDYFIEAPPRS